VPEEWGEGSALKNAGTRWGDILSEHASDVPAFASIVPFDLLFSGILVAH
jgi:hypothetical protein